MKYFESISNSLSWAGFAVILISILAIGFFYFRFINPRLNRLNNQEGEERFNIHVIDRLVAICLVLPAILFFIVVNPPLNSVIALFLFIIFYESLINFAIGLTLIIEANLREGKEVEIGKDQGVLKGLKWTGLTVSEGTKAAFIPYKRVSREGVSVVQGNIPQVVNFICRWEDLIEPHQAQTRLQGKLFSFPFVLNGTKPTYLIDEKSIKVSLALTSSNYMSSLSEMLQQAGFSIEMINT